jgi:acyl carrier protein
MDLTARTLDIIGRISGKEPSALAPEADLVGDLGIDSPKGLQLLVELEEALGIEISDEQAARLDTVGDVLAFVTQHR